MSQLPCMAPSNVCKCDVHALRWGLPIVVLVKRCGAQTRWGRSGMAWHSEIHIFQVHSRLETRSYILIQSDLMHVVTLACSVVHLCIAIVDLASAKGCKCLNGRKSLEKNSCFTTYQACWTKPWTKPRIIVLPSTALGTDTWRGATAVTFSRGFEVSLRSLSSERRWLEWQFEMNALRREMMRKGHTELHLDEHSSSSKWSSVWPCQHCFKAAAERYDMKGSVQSNRTVGRNETRQV